MFTQHKYEAYDTQGHLLGFLWANDTDEAEAISTERWEGKCSRLRVTRIKKRAPIHTHRAGYKADFYAKKGAFAHA